jgi:hypothetical protein
MRTRFSKTHVSTWLLPAGLGGALALMAGCNASPTSGQMAAGLWSCFDTGSGVACVKQSTLSTADVDVNGDGIPDHFVCADDDDDGHDRGRDRDQNDHAVSGHDADHDGVDDDLDCDARPACQGLSDDDNPDRQQAAEVETHAGETCAAPTT